MELKVKIELDELLHVIQQLPKNQRTILKDELNKEEKPKEKYNDFQKFLLNGPVMSDEEYETFKDTRKRLNKWRTK